MMHDENPMPMPGQRKAFIRDGALVLYFDNADTPFVARFDLDSLAQANFEVADKHENIYPLTLRDFSGQVQIVGQFATKADAHQALYAILQALLSHKGDDADAVTGPCGFWCVMRKVVKWILLVTGAVVLAYNLLVIAARPFSTVRHAPQENAVQAPVEEQKSEAAPEANTSEVQEPKAADLSAIPEGEAVDADSLLAPEEAGEATPQASSDTKSE